MRIELISPYMKDHHNVGNFFRIPQISLALLASLTPPEIEVSITDELVEMIRFDEKPDLVGITVNTQTALRAYEIADAYRGLGVPVVLGGIHPSVVPEEAIQHADGVIIGEAEELWPRALEDFRRGRLSRFYTSASRPSLHGVPIPRRELLKANKYETVNLVQTSRGCPYGCQFCSVSTQYGAGVRLRPLDNLFQEIASLQGEMLFFVDDNIVGKSAYAEEMLQRLIPLGKRWVGQASITVASDEKIVRLLRKSGCLGLLVGFESISKDCLREVGKVQNSRQDYSLCIERLHDHGISILGSFIVGFDHDDLSCFERLLEFVRKTKIDVVDICTLTPYPGTAFYRKLKEEGRLLDERWWLRYSSNDVVYQPRSMTRTQLREGWSWALKEMYRLYPMTKRCLEGLHRRPLVGNLITWKANRGYRGRAQAAAALSCP